MYRDAESYTEIASYHAANTVENTQKQSFVDGAGKRSDVDYTGLESRDVIRNVIFRLPVVGFLTDSAVRFAISVTVRPLLM